MGIIAVSWVVFIVILLLFPSGSTTTAQTMSEFIPFRVPHLENCANQLRGCRLCGGHCDVRVHLRVGFLGVIST